MQIRRVFLQLNITFCLKRLSVIRVSALNLLIYKR